MSIDTESDIPFSQDTSKPQEATREEVIADLHALVEAQPDKIISRNFYRVNGSFAESAWSKHFGTWGEFKRAANVTPTRHATRMESDIAKHASVEAFRAMNVEKQGWEDVYARPDARRFQTHMILTDVHDIDCDPFYRRIAIETIERVRPSKVILGGDLFDLPEFSKYTQDPRSWDVVGRIRWVHEFLRAIREASPESEIVLIEGNHEFRLLRHLAEASPAMRAVLSDLHGWTVPKLLGLDEFEVNYIARADLATFNQGDIGKELQRNYLIVDDAFLVHHFPEGKAMGYPGCNGHHHKHIVWPNYSPIFGSFEWHQIGCGHSRIASYTPGEKWSNGFLLAHVDTQKKHTAFEYLDCTFDHAVIGGRWYERAETERLVK